MSPVDTKLCFGGLGKSVRFEETTMTEASVRVVGGGVRSEETKTVNFSVIKTKRDYQLMKCGKVNQSMNVPLTIRPASLEATL